MAEKPLRTETIDGTPIAIYLDDEGHFIARNPGDPSDWLRADSLKQLIDKLRKKLRTSQLRLDIPMTLLKTGQDHWRSKKGDPVAEPVTLTGMHARSRKALLTYANGEKDTYDGYDGILTRRLTEDEAKEWVATVTAKHEAEAKLEQVKDRLSLTESVELFVREYVKQHSETATGDLSVLDEVETR